jgi:hypothetical protein
MIKVNGKTGGTKATIVTGDTVTCDHVTFHPPTDSHWQLRTTFDFTDVSRETMLRLASETLVIRWRNAFKNADAVDETADNQTVSVKEMLKGSKPRMSKKNKLVRDLSDMSELERLEVLAHLAKLSGLEVVLPTIESEETEQE